MISRIRSRFFAYGYLLPALVPLAAVGGRALADLLVVAYLLWALLACRGLRPRGAEWLLGGYGLLLVALFASVPGAADPILAARTWAKFMLYSGVLYFTLVALQHRAEGGARLVHFLGLAGGALLLLLWIQLPLFLGEDDLRFHLREDDLPLFTPFLLHLAAAVTDRWWRRAAFGGVLGALFGYIVLSQGRAALLAALVAVALYFCLVGRWRLRRLLLTVGALAAVAIALSWSGFHRLADGGGGWVELVDGFSSNRTLLWRQAFRHPPADPWNGIGIGNLKDHPSPALVISGSERVSHFHNFVVDVWYETGWIGLGALLLFLSLSLIRAARAWPRLAPEAREPLALALAAAAAILAAATLSFSYGSREFAIYLFLMVGMIHHFSTIERREMDGEEAGG